MSALGLRPGPCLGIRRPGRGWRRGRIPWQSALWSLGPGPKPILLCAAPPPLAGRDECFVSACGAEGRRSGLLLELTVSAPGADCSWAPHISFAPSAHYPVLATASPPLGPRAFAAAHNFPSQFRAPGHATLLGVGAAGSSPVAPLVEGHGTAPATARFLASPSWAWRSAGWLCLHVHCPAVGPRRPWAVPTILHPFRLMPEFLIGRGGGIHPN